MNPQRLCWTPKRWRPLALLQNHPKGVNIHGGLDLGRGPFYVLLTSPGLLCSCVTFHLAQAISSCTGFGEEAETIESLAEPFLVRMGFLARTPRGRVATELGWNQLGLKAPADLATSQVSNLASLFDTPTNEA